MTILFGTNLYPATGEAARRQENSSRSLLALTGVELVNLQFQDRQALVAREGMETLAVLRHDSPGVAGVRGVRKPVVGEMFQVLGEEAVKRGHRYFAFSNSDILVCQEAIDLMLSGGLESYIFSRVEFDGRTGENLEVLIYGADCFAVEASWWARNRVPFRPYVVGEPCWDNVYAAQLLCHSRSVLFNRGSFIRHERHDIIWRKSPFARYTHYLATLDSLYFSLWCAYVRQLEELRAKQATEPEELALQGRVFRWRPTLWSRLTQWARATRAHWRHYWQRGMELCSR